MVAQDRLRSICVCFGLHKWPLNAGLSVFLDLYQRASLGQQQWQVWRDKATRGLEPLVQHVGVQPFWTLAWTSTLSYVHVTTSKHAATCRQPQQSCRGAWSAGAACRTYIKTVMTYGLIKCCMKTSVDCRWDWALTSLMTPAILPCSIQASIVHCLHVFHTQRVGIPTDIVNKIEGSLDWTQANCRVLAVCPSDGILSILSIYLILHSSNISHN